MAKDAGSVSDPAACLGFGGHRGGAGQPSHRASGAGQPRKHHQIDMATRRMAPFAELRRQGPMLLAERLGFQILQALVDQIQGVVDQLGGLFRGHGTRAVGPFVPAAAKGRCSAAHRLLSLSAGAHRRGSCPLGCGQPLHQRLPVVLLTHGVPAALDQWPQVLPPQGPRGGCRLSSPAQPSIPKARHAQSVIQGKSAGDLPGRWSGASPNFRPERARCITLVGRTGKAC